MEACLFAVENLGLLFHSLVVARRLARGMENCPTYVLSPDMCQIVPSAEVSAVSRGNIGLFFEKTATRETDWCDVIQQYRGRDRWGSFAIRAARWLRMGAGARLPCDILAEPISQQVGVQMPRADLLPLRVLYRRSAFSPRLSSCAGCLLVCSLLARSRGSSRWAALAGLCSGWWGVREARMVTSWLVEVARGLSRGDIHPVECELDDMAWCALGRSLLSRRLFSSSPELLASHTAWPGPDGVGRQ